MKKIIQGLFISAVLCFIPVFGFASEGSVAIVQGDDQTHAVTGTIADAAGPVVGVTVLIKGTNTGVVTDFNGVYTINAKNSDVLVFSCLGYKDQEVPVNTRAKIDVLLSEDAEMLDETVVVGYGTMKKRNIVGAVENLSGKAIESRPNVDITRSLQGQIPGLNIVQTDGKVDHSGTMTIRGVSNSFQARVTDGYKSNSLGQGGSVLVLIDGAEGDLSSVNAEDVETISVLKDASSAAVYGARGAWGVILVTTKNPDKGTVKVTYNGSVSFHQRTVMWEDGIVQDSVGWVDRWREAYLNSTPTSTVPTQFNNYVDYSDAWFEELKVRQSTPGSSVYSTSSSGKYSYYDNINWYSEFYKRYNMSTTHTISVQGGNETAKYYVSGRYYTQDGIYKVGEENYNKYNIRAKGSVRIRKWLDLQNNTSVSYTKYHQPMMHYSQFTVPRQIAYFGVTFVPPTNEDGTWTQTAAKLGYAAFSEGTSWQENINLEVANTTTLTFTFIPEVFTVTADFTYKAERWSRDRMENQYTYYTGLTSSGVENASSESSLENWTYKSDYLSSNVVANVTPKLGKKHDLDIMVGWNLEDYDYHSQKTYREGNLYPEIPSFTLMDGEYYSTTAGGNSWGLVGFFGRINYAFDKRFIAEFSARYDGSSRFPSYSQWGFFPSGSIGWRISEEPWVKPHVENWMDNLKIRASIGSLGNANVSPYTYLETMSVSKTSVLINGQKTPYVGSPSLVPDDVTWEEVVTYDVGLDMDFFNNRLSFVGDYYQRYVNNLYTVGPNLPHVLGASAPKGNYGSLKTNGWELSLGWRDHFNLGGKPFTYEVKAMLWDSRSWVTDYYNETGDITTYYKGMQIGEIWGFRTAGIYASNADALNGPDYNFLKNGEMFRAYAGDLIYVDVDGNGIIEKGARTLDNHGDLTIIGNQQPRYNYGINIDLSWNGIGVSMFWQGVGKRDWYPWTETSLFWGQWNRAYGPYIATQSNSNRAIVDKSTDNWVVTNMDQHPYWTRLVSLAANRNDGPLTWENDHFLQDASYIRLKNLTVSYTFSREMCRKMKIQGLKIYVTGENLWTWSPMFKYTEMFDPEVIATGDSDFSNSTSPGLSGTGNGESYPMLKSYTIGVNFSF